MQWCFRICARLGIDDPIHWMQCVPSKVVDQWIAYLLIEAEQKQAAAAADPLGQLQQRIETGIFG